MRKVPHMFYCTLSTPHLSYTTVISACVLPSSVVFPSAPLHPRLSLLALFATFRSSLLLLHSSFPLERASTSGDHALGGTLAALRSVAPALLSRDCAREAPCLRGACGLLPGSASSNRLTSTRSCASAAGEGRGGSCAGAGWEGGEGDGLGLGCGCWLASVRLSSTGFGCWCCGDRDVFWAMGFGEGWWCGFCEMVLGERSWASLRKGSGTG